MKKIIIFDLDGTLTESKTKIDGPMARLFCELLKNKFVAVISGASFEQFKWQFLSGLACENLFGKLFILPESGAELWRLDSGEWKKKYSQIIPEELRKKVIFAIAEMAHIPSEKIKYFIDDLESEVSYSALGLAAPLDKKKLYDPYENVRRDFVSKIAPDFPELSFHIGGTTTVNITAKGIDKAFGVRQLLEHAHINVSDALFVGDALYAGGNDEAAEAAGEDVLSTSGPEETKKIIETILNEK